MPMKKAAIIMQQKDAEGCIRALRSLGVVHVEHQQVPKGKDINLLHDDLALVNQALEVISEEEFVKKYKIKEEKKSIVVVQESIKHFPIPLRKSLEVVAKGDFLDWRQAVTRIIDLWKRLDHLQEYSRALTQQISDWQVWGDFDPLQVNSLSQKGIYIKLYQVPVKQINEFPQGVVVKNIFTASGFAHCVAIARKPLECAFKEIPLPKQGLSAFKERLAEDKKAIAAIKNEIFKSACFYESFLEIKKKLEKDIEFQQVLGGMGKERGIVYVAGYIPFDAQGYLIAEAKEREWGIVISDPSGDDNVPTLVRNPRWASVIKPVLGLLGITPGYHELDVSTLFLVFFSIFFGILIGDAGYGLVYMLLTVWLQKKRKRNIAMKNIISLFYILSSCAVIWGALTGTFFGQGWLVRLGYKPLVAQLNDAKFMQALCFFLGALHLSIAHSWRASLKFPSLTALADVGWICVLWGAFFLVRTLILGDLFPCWGRWLIIAGIVLVVLFTNPQANMLKAISEGLGTVALSLMNNFTDVVSYVRLFAVGLAGVAIADTTNTMASGLGGGAVALVAGAVIAIVGHALNIVLGPMSVLVHGVRLNVLEFSGHANVTWSGLAYEPLKE